MRTAGIAATPALVSGSNIAGLEKALPIGGRAFSSPSGACHLFGAHSATCHARRESMTKEQTTISDHEGNAESRYEVYLKIMNTRNVLQFLSESIGERGRSNQDDFDIGVEQVLLDQVDRLDGCMGSDELGAWSLPSK